jgi:HEAT repeat protein
MNVRAVLLFGLLLLVAALILLILLWPPQMERQPVDVVRVAPAPSPTPIPPFPSPTAPVATPAAIEPTPAEPVPSAIPSQPTIDDLDVLYAGLAPAVLAKDKRGVLEILDRMAAFGDRAVDRLTVLLNNPTDENVREYAALGLAKIGTPAALAKLLEAIRNQPDSRLKENLRAELRQMRSSAALDLVIDGLLQDSADWWFKDASSILSSMGTPEVVSRLLDASREAGEQHQGRLGATFTQITNPEAIPALGSALQAGAHPMIQEGASRALAQIGTPEATDTLLQAVRAVEENDHRERLLAAFDRLANKDSTQILQQALDDETNPAVRAAAANALGNNENEPVLAHLERAYERETDPRAKAAIARAIQRLGARSM